MNKSFFSCPVISQQHYVKLKEFFECKLNMNWFSNKNWFKHNRGDKSVIQDLMHLSPKQNRSNWQLCLISDFHFDQNLFDISYHILNHNAGWQTQIFQFFSFFKSINEPLICNASTCMPNESCNQINWVLGKYHGLQHILPIFFMSTRPDFFGNHKRNRRVDEYIAGS